MPKGGKKESRKKWPCEKETHAQSEIARTGKSSRPDHLTRHVDNYTPLIAFRSQILMEKDFFRRLLFMSGSAKRDYNKYCWYHRDHGHNIEECRQLKQEFENLIHKGYLGKYINAQRKEEVPLARFEHRVELDNLSIEETVNVISGLP